MLCFFSNESLLSNVQSEIHLARRNVVSTRQSSRSLKKLYLLDNDTEICSTHYGGKAVVPE